MCRPVVHVADVGHPLGLYALDHCLSAQTHQVVLLRNSFVQEARDLHDRANTALRARQTVQRRITLSPYLLRYRLLARKHLDQSLEVARYSGLRLILNLRFRHGSPNDCRGQSRDGWLDDPWRLPQSELIVPDDGRNSQLPRLLHAECDKDARRHGGPLSYA